MTMMMMMMMMMINNELKSVKSIDKACRGLTGKD